MKSRKDYIFTAQVDDKFKALGYDNDVYVWDMQTGKQLSTNLEVEESKLETRKQRRSTAFRISRRVANSNFEDNSRGWEVFRSHSEYENKEIGLYNQGLLPYTLVYKTDSSKNQELENINFYKDRIRNYRQIQINALKQAEKTFHDFAAVGLDEDGGISIKVQFVFPRLKQKDIAIK